MQVYEPIMFHKAYPMESFLEENQIMEKERQLMYSYLPEEYRRIQRKAEEVCDTMEYEGSRMYDEHPDGMVLRHMAGRMLKELGYEGKDRYLEDIACCFLCNEMLCRRYRMRRSRQYIR